MRLLRKNAWVRKLSMVVMDVLLVSIASYVSMELRFEGAIPAHHMETMLENMPRILICYCAAFCLGGVYNIMWRYAGVKETARVAVVCALGGALTLAVNMFAGLGLFRGVLILISLLSMILVGGIRFLWRVLSSERPSYAGGKFAPMMIIGAGEAGAYAITTCLKNKREPGKPVLLVDDDPMKKGLRIQGIPVKGTTEDIPELVRDYDIQEIIVAIPSLTGWKMDKILSLCSETKCHVRVVSEPSEVEIDAGNDQPFIRELNVADFLSRDEIQLDTEKISEYLQGKTVLVTGGGGSIGSEICRQIMRFAPKLLIIFDIYENCAYELEYELKQQHGRDCPVEVLIGSIRDRKRLDEVFEAYEPDVVFHAAAHKHVPLMEKSPAEAIKNNVFGTKNLLDSASAHGVERLVQLSTDKAVNPTNIMGATKRITEMLIQAYAKRSTMKCMAVRFGNVLGSHGSVIPLLEAQIRKGGPVTVTHPDITRYFMTIPEAAQLVLQAGGIAQSGSIFVLDMGEPVRIMDLAEKLIRAYGYEPNVDMEIKITGLRPGEKLYEELLMESERDRMRKTAHKKIFVAPVDEIEPQLLERQLQMLSQAMEHNDSHVAEAISQVVPTYRPKPVEKAS